MSVTRFTIKIATREREILEIRNFEIVRNKINFLFGESGIGKTLSAKAIYGLLDPREWRVEINGRPYETYLESRRAVEMKQQGFFVFQEPSSHLNPLLTLQAQLREGSLEKARTGHEILQYLWDTSHAAPFKKILTVYPKPYRPSGGEKQRILLTMAFKKIDLYMNTPEPSPYALFIFDEPSGSLDNFTRNLFLNLLCEQFRMKPFTALLITHDYSMISEMIDRHQELVDDMAFKELAKRQDRLALRVFSPHLYLEWLQATKETPRPEPRRVSVAGSNDVLLRMESGVVIFGRRLIFSRYPDGYQRCSLILKRNKVVYLKAPSGVGKTTIAKIIMGLHRAHDLELTIGNLQITGHTPLRVWQEQIWGKKVGMVFQHADEALNLNTRVKDILNGLPHRRKITPEYVKRQLTVYFPFEIDEAFMNKRIRFLSGGQMQRLNLMRTLSLDTDVVILDEPLNGLDFNSIKRVIDLLQTRLKKGKGILVISHNEEIFDSLADTESIYLRAEDLNAGRY